MNQIERIGKTCGLRRRARWIVCVLSAASAGVGYTAHAPASVSSSGDANAIIDNGDGTYSVDTSEFVALVVGYDAEGSLAIDGGSQLESPFIPEPDIAVEIGQFDTSSGSVSVSGEGSGLFAESELCVGDAGGGSLNILSGGAVYAGDASIGGGDTNNNGIGGVTVDGEGSNFSVIGTLSIGNFGTGSMSIQNGGSVNCHFGSIGSFEGSSGDVQVNTGGEWDCAVMTVGYGSTGTLEIASGGTVTVDDGGFVSVGSTLDGSDGDGTITIDGAGSQLNVGGSVAIGDLSTGELDITNNGALSETGFFSIGNNASGTVNVSSGGTIIAPSLYMGSNPGGRGTLSIDGSDTSVEIDGTTVIGGDADGAGTINVTNGAGLKLLGTNYIGDNGAGSIYISGGSTVEMGATYVANTPSGNGYISVDGTGTTLTFDSFASIGTWGTGEMDITNGAQVTCESAWIGDIGGDGTVLVDGEGSLLHQYGFAEAVNVGNQSGTTGTLTVQNQGSVTGDIMFIGGDGGSTGTVNVDGAGTTVTFGNFITVGNFGTGTMNITNGAVVTSTYGYVGGSDGGSGTVTVNGTGSEWHVTSYFSFGTFYGTANVNVQDGAVMTSDGIIYFGQFQNSNGTATIDGLGSALNCTNQLLVGEVSDGTLTVQNQATSSSGLLVVGDSGGSDGTVNIIGGATAVEPLHSLLSIGGGDGASASMTTGPTTIGESGTGVLSITAGGLLTSNGPGIIGDAFTAGASGGSDTIGIGTATISDPGSTWNLTANTLTIGNAGSGMLLIENGATVTSGAGSIGVAAGSTGSVTVTGSGSTWNVGSTDLTIAGAGTGSLSINTGGAVTNVNNAIVGSSSGSSGSVIVAGPGTSWTLADNLTIGESGHGVMSISGTATVSDINGILGDQSSGVGRMTVDGTGGASTWMNSGDITVGISGTGTLTLQNGGKAKGDNGVLAYDLNSTGTANVNTSSSWTATGEIIVGRGGTGTMNIMSKGKVTDNEAHIGLGALASGTVLIDGSGSQWMNNGPLTIGENGIGKLTAQNGGGLNSTDGYIGGYPGSSGTVLITGSGSLWHLGGSLYVGGSASAVGGPASLTVNNSGTLTVNGTLTIWPTGIVNLDGGSHSFGGLVIQSGGTLEMSNSKLAVAYTGPAPTTTIRALLSSGFAKGAWDGTGINSTAAATSPGHAIGYMDEGDSQFELDYTFDGDTNLDGVINSEDLANMQDDGSDWSDGDLNYDGVENADDWSLFSLGVAEQSEEDEDMPEPSAVMYVLAPVISLLRRRRASI